MPTEDEIQQFSASDNSSSDEDDIEELWAKENNTVFLEEEEEHLQSSESFPISDFKIKGPIPGSKIDQLQNSGLKSTIEKQLITKRLMQHRDQEEDVEIEDSFAID